VTPTAPRPAAPTPLRRAQRVRATPPDRIRRATRRQRRVARARYRREHVLRVAVAPVALLLGTASLLFGSALVATPGTAGVGTVGAPVASAGEGTTAVLGVVLDADGSTATASGGGDDLLAPLPGPGNDAELPSADRTAASGDQVAPDRPARPTLVELRTIGVRAPLVPLALDEDQQLEVPSDPATAGWYTGGPRPGEPGPAVIVGHVDSQRGPAVFHPLPRLAPGDEVVVHRTDGTTATFRVDRLAWWPKDRFPTDAVYRDADGAELRLITCAGRFDRASRSYEDNLIVFASAVDVP
jgi:hypothetical protein